MREISNDHPKITQFSALFVLVAKNLAKRRKKRKEIQKITHFLSFAIPEFGEKRNSQPPG